MVLEKFRQATINWNQQLNSAVEEEGLEESEAREEEDEKKSHLVVVTDVCLPMLSSGESSLSSRVLVNYELPTKKENYSRRLTSCLASSYWLLHFHLLYSSPCPSTSNLKLVKWVYEVMEKKDQRTKAAYVSKNLSQGVSA
ncbi:hypothetical protein Rs2_29418 [Raphanus sativus]|nr:hypothetical protein Rs2_29418 [Raphanus sativus]